MKKKLLNERIDQSIKQYEATSNIVELDNIEKEFKKYLKENPQDGEVLMRLATFVNQAPLADFPQSIKYLEQLLAQDSQNIKALLLLVEIQSSNLGLIDEKTCSLLFSAQTNDNELMSMIEYLKASYYRLNDKEEYEKHLLNSVTLYSKHAHNNKELGEIYINKGKIKEGYELIGRALRSITCLFPNTYIYFDTKVFNIITPDEYIAEFITGTKTSYDRVKSLGEYYVTCRSLLNEQK